MSKVLTIVEKSFTAAGAGGTVLIMLAVSLQVISRYVAKAFPGVYESAEMLVVAVIFLPLAYTQSLKRHLKMSLLVSRLSDKWHGVLYTITMFLSLSICVIITWQSGQIAWTAWRVGDTSMGIIMFPTWPSKILVPIGAGLLCLRLAVDLIRGFISKEYGKQEKDK